MSDLSIDLVWKRTSAELLPGQFSNLHDVTYNQQFQLKADAAPDWGGNAEYTNPEQALAAALSSCHLMTFLALAAKVKWPVASFSDHAVAHLGKNAKSQMSVTKIDLHPTVEFDPGFEVSDEELKNMHDRAHRYCFIANTLDSSVEINIH
ncbi:MAG: organic hydroperoxide reductase OsmC/OhrA [Candidatus Azotimanducaceae bacterium]|jgi:organic hydroperoxide reductase OsmC/OhrA